MAYVSNPYAARRQGYRTTLAEQRDAMQDVAAGIAAIDEAQERRRLEAEKRKRQETADTLATNERTYQRGREASQDAERTREREAIAEQRKVEADRRKAEADRADMERRREETVRSTSVAMAGGLSRDELAKRAQAAGMSGPEDLLAAVDDIEQRRLQAEEARQQKLDLEAARERQATEAANRAARGPAPKAPPSEASRRMADAKLREAEAKAKIAEREASGQPRAGGAAAAGGAQAATRKAKVQGLASDLDLLERSVAEVERTGADPGQVTGRIRSLKSAVVDDEAQTAFEAAAAAVNSQIFGLLRTDAPSESEAKVIQALQFSPTDTPAKIRAKMRTVRSIIAARGADEEAPLDVLANRVKGTTIPDNTPPVPPAKPKTGDDEFDSLPD